MTSEAPADTFVKAFASADTSQTLIDRISLSFHEVVDKLSLILIRRNIRMSIHDFKFILLKFFFLFLLFLDRLFMFVSNGLIKTLIFLHEFILMSLKFLFFEIIV